MIQGAAGYNATIELYEHHLVIKRYNGGIILGPAQQFIPLSSIKSIGFIPPGFLTPGRIVFSLEGSATRRTGTLKDENSVLFPKFQQREFERVLHAVREAIATPSIERLAMAAQQRQRLYSSQAPASDERAIQVLSGHDAQEGWTGAPDDRTVHHEPHSRMADNEDQNTPLPLSRGGWWRDMPLIGKAILIAFAAILLLSMCSTGTSSPNQSADVASAEASSPADRAKPTAEAMLSDWSEFATGEPRTSQFAMTDGSGTPGEFCNATDGENIMIFGSLDTGDGAKIFDMFSKRNTRSDTGYMGAFWFDRASGELRALRLIQKKYADRPPENADDLAMKVIQVSPGVVSVDGENYHFCVI